MKQILFVSLLVFIISNNLRNLASYNWSSAYSQLVTKHNEYRAKHKAGKLTTLSALATLSQTVANNCAAKGALNHIKQEYSGKPVGQNLFAMGTTGSGPTGNFIAESWYNEYKDYDFAKGQSKNGNMIGHFTQMVWVSTKQIGCAYAIGKYNNRNDLTGYYVCCDYFPAGNYQGQYTKNVLK